MRVAGVRIRLTVRLYWFFRAKRLRKRYPEEWGIGVIRAFAAWQDPEMREAWMPLTPTELKWYAIQELILKRDNDNRQIMSAAQNDFARSLMHTASWKKQVERQEAESLGLVDTLAKLRSGAIRAPETRAEFHERVRKEGGYYTREGKWIDSSTFLEGRDGVP